ncbi:DUF4383 domain-containing protein [Kocuria sediminis]|uniref:DUF4383 domain-containing protein n=1 Tax=Kocuria sediminis TaxID=1038857 RepID=A0A6N8GUN8_9MICC|nr:DUF4383 domain-containing protein [Kocuria sediminis]
MLLGIFQVSWLHNIVHLLYGVAGLALTRSAAGARSFLLWGGLVYLVLWIYGLLVGPESPANVVPVNTADDWLHLVLGVTMVGLSFLRRDTHDRSATRNTTGRPTDHQLLAGERDSGDQSAVSTSTGLTAPSSGRPPALPVRSVSCGAGGHLPLPRSRRRSGRDDGLSLRSPCGTSDRPSAEPAGSGGGPGSRRRR